MDFLQQNEAKHGKKEQIKAERSVVQAEEIHLDENRPVEIELIRTKFAANSHSMLELEKTIKEKMVHLKAAKGMVGNKEGKTSMTKIPKQ